MNRLAVLAGKNRQKAKAKPEPHQKKEKKNKMNKVQQVCFEGTMKNGLYKLRAQHGFSLRCIISPYELQQAVEAINVEFGKVNKVVKKFAADKKISYFFAIPTLGLSVLSIPTASSSFDEKYSQAVEEAFSAAQQRLNELSAKLQGNVRFVLRSKETCAGRKQGPISNRGLSIPVLEVQYETLDVVGNVVPTG